METPIIKKDITRTTNKGGVPLNTLDMTKMHSGAGFKSVQQVFDFLLGEKIV